MDRMYRTYQAAGAVLHAAASLSSPFVRACYPAFFSSFQQRMGIYHDHLLQRRWPNQPCIWLHAASVGEVGVAVSLMNVLHRQNRHARFVLSTFTAAGQRHARRLLKISETPHTACILAPADTLPTVNRALKTIDPDMIVCLETELWPVLLRSAQCRGIKTALINGRISQRSVNHYLHIRSLIQPVLQRLDVISVISTIDAQRLRRIGGRKLNITVNGNTKFDSCLSKAVYRQKDQLQSLLNLECGKASVIVAGSTRQNEPQMVLDAFDTIRDSIADAVLIIAPRHPRRAKRIQQIVHERGFSCQMRSTLDTQPRTAAIIVMDTLGELSAVYGLAQVVFCGGSLAPLGGQNIIEPALWGKPVLFGPHMDDFKDACKLLVRAGGGKMIANTLQLAQETITLLTHPEACAAMGHQARQTMDAHRGAVTRHANMLRLFMQPT